MMLWYRGARFFFKLAIVAIFAVFLSLNPGSVSVSWFGYHIEMPVSLLLVGLFLILAFSLVMHGLWRKLWQIPERYWEYLKKRREIKGEKLLIEALTAISAQQPEEAQHSVELAKVLLPDHPLTFFVAAQSAHMNQDHAKAKLHFEAMSKHPNLRFLGLRGLILQAQEQKDWLRAENLLKQALKLRPDSPWVQEQIKNNQLTLINAGQAQHIATQSIERVLTPEQTQAHQAMSYWLKAQHEKEDTQEYLTLLQKANALSPSNVAIACALALAYQQLNNGSKAQKVLLNTYKISPHREIAACWLKINPTLKPLETYQALEKLAHLHPHHPETLWMMAQAAFEAHLWGQSYKFLQELQKDYGDTKEVCHLMAQLEEVQHPHRHDVVRQWWKRAVGAAVDPSWICQKCSQPQESWQAICQSCGAVDQSQWQGFQPLPKQALLEGPKS